MRAFNCFGMIAVALAIAGGCCFFRYDLQPQGVHRLRVSQIDAPMGASISIKGFAFDSTYSPHGFSLNKKGDVLYVRIKMEMGGCPTFDYRFPIPSNVSKIMWGETCLWTRNGGVATAF